MKNTVSPWRNRDDPIRAVAPAGSSGALTSFAGSPSFAAAGLGSSALAADRASHAVPPPSPTVSSTPAASAHLTVAMVPSAPRASSTASADAAPSAASPANHSPARTVAPDTGAGTAAPADAAVSSTPTPAAGQTTPRLASRSRSASFAWPSRLPTDPTGSPVARATCS